MPLIIWARKTHLYVGVFLAPAILFFAATGMLQVLSLHQSSPGYTAPVLLQRLGALHKDQVFGAPRKADADADAKADRAAGDAATKSGAPARKPRPIGIARWMLKGFAEIVGAGLIVNTLLGLYMACRINRTPWVLGGLFAAGVLIPVILVVALPS